MPSKEDIYYQALLARDYRFDGKFYVGVKTTGVYCRPICPARPARQNVEFFPHAPAAQRAGYRPCLRCRPESAPESPAWFGKSALVQRALKLIAANHLHQSDEDTFAQQLGVTARHLRRLFDDEVGQTPKRISDHARLDFARKLVTETHLPMTQAAMTAGFSSLRRFNAAFKSRFRRTPTQVRRHRAAPDSSRGVELTLSYRPPLDWQDLLAFFRHHPIAGLERVTDHQFERLFHLNQSTGLLQVSPLPDKPQLRLHVLTDDPSILFEVTRRVRRMFDLDSDPVLVANAFASVPLLNRLYRARPGLRVARGWDPFESAIRTILGQLVSVTHATTLVTQLVQAYGQEVNHPITGDPVRLFPTPERLATSALAEVKTTAARRQAIRAFSRLITTGQLQLTDAQDPADFRKSLLAIPGIGHWTAEYVSLRAIGDTDAFPATDLILCRVLDLHPDLDLDAVKPWRSYAAIYLWNQYAGPLSKRKEPAP